MRLFIAVPVENPKAVRYLGECRRELETARADVKWVSAGQYHCTMRFLGEVDEGRVEALRKAVRQCASGTQPVSACLITAGVFERNGIPGVIRVDMRDDSGLLMQLEKRLSEVLATLDFPPGKRAFHPHITLGRGRSARNTAALRQAVRRWSGEVCCPLDRLVLYESVFRPDGPVYHALESVPFGPTEVNGVA